MFTRFINNNQEITMRILEKINLKDVLFLDIETSTQVKDLEIDTPLYDAWKYKKQKEVTDDSVLPNLYQNEAALYPEFGRIVCITVGRIIGGKFAMQTFKNLNEKELLNDFNNMLDKQNDCYICGYSIKQFDIPFILQRGYHHSIKPHTKLDTSGLKPWELDHIIDTKELWKGTSFNNPSLIGVCTSLGIKSPKEELQGSDVPKFFWLNPEKNIKTITEYCERDVFSTYRVLEKLKTLEVHKQTDIKPHVTIINLDDSHVEEELENGGLLDRLMSGGSYTKKIKEELIKRLSNMTNDEKEKAFVILNSIISTAKGKTTKFTKKHLKELKEEVK